MAKTYSEKLLDPRWQKKRLEILSRDNWSCTCCGDTKSSLQIHHLKYGRLPWSIKNEYLVTVCSSCHFIYEELKKSTDLNIHKVTKRYNKDNSSFMYIVKYDSKFNGEIVISFMVKKKDGKSGYNLMNGFPFSEDFIDYLKKLF